MIKLADKINNPILAYNAALLLNQPQHQEQILRDCGLDALAELAAEANSGELSQRMKALGSRPLESMQPEN